MKTMMIMHVRLNQIQSHANVKLRTHLDLLLFDYHHDDIVL